MHVSVIRGAPPKVPVIALIAPVRTDLQQRMCHSFNKSPSPGSVYQMAAAPRTLLLLAGMYKIHIGPQNKNEGKQYTRIRLQGEYRKPCK
jgi:hypothetical protein